MRLPLASGRDSLHRSRFIASEAEEAEHDPKSFEDLENRYDRNAQPEAKLSANIAQEVRNLRKESINLY